MADLKFLPSLSFDLMCCLSTVFFLGGVMVMRMHRLYFNSWTSLWGRKVQLTSPPLELLTCHLISDFVSAGHSLLVPLRRPECVFALCTCTCAHLLPSTGLNILHAQTSPQVSSGLSHLCTANCWHHVMRSMENIFAKQFLFAFELPKMSF